MNSQTLKIVHQFIGIISKEEMDKNKALQQKVKFLKKYLSPEAFVSHGKNRIPHSLKNLLPAKEL